MTGVTPRCLALVLCRSVAREAISGNATVVGALQVFEVDAFPATSPPFSVWLQVTDGNGKLTMQLIIEYVPPDGPDCEAILEIPFSLNFDDPNMVREHEAVWEDGIALEVEGNEAHRKRHDDPASLLRRQDEVGEATHVQDALHDYDDGLTLGGAEDRALFLPDRPGRFAGEHREERASCSPEVIPPQPPEEEALRKGSRGWRPPRARGAR